MKRILQITFVLLISLNCNRSIGQSPIKGKLVYRSCASVVIEVLTPKNYTLGQKSWKQPGAKGTFKNVFTVANPCQFPESLEVGQELYFKTTKVEDKDCMTCDLFDNPPTKRQLITVTKTNSKR